MSPRTRARHPARLPGAADLQDASASQRPIILCLDDNDTYLWLRAKLLEREGYIVLRASTPAEAINLFKLAPVDVVISDHMLGLGAITGATLCEEFRRMKPGVPLMLYSGTPPKSSEHVDCFVYKCEPVDTFLKIVRDLVRRHRGELHYPPYHGLST